MSIDIEQTLARELREVAEGLQVPPMPTLQQEPPVGRRHWRPLLVAASVALIVVGAITVQQVASRGGQGLQPAQTLKTTSTQNPSSLAARIPRTPPTVPYVLNQRLYVDSTEVSGRWQSVWFGGDAWIGLRTDNSWWTGMTQPQAHGGLRINRVSYPGLSLPVISPNGRYVADTVVAHGQGNLTGFETRVGGEGLGAVPVDLGSGSDGSRVTVRAVTDDGKVIAQGTRTSIMWLPLKGNRTVDLSVTAPGQQILQSTAAGLVVTDGVDGTPYLARVSDSGKLARIGTIPVHDDLVVSPGAVWLAYTSRGTTSGHETSTTTLMAQRADGTGRTALTAPAGWTFEVQSLRWEDDHYLVSAVTNHGAQRMARCSPEAARCVLIKAP